MKNLKQYGKLFESSDDGHVKMLVSHGFSVVENPTFQVSEYTTVLEKPGEGNFVGTTIYRVVLEEGSAELYCFTKNMVLNWSITFSSGVPLKVLELTIKTL